MSDDPTYDAASKHLDESLRNLRVSVDAAMVAAAIRTAIPSALWPAELLKAIEIAKEALVHAEDLPDEWREKLEPALSIVKAFVSAL
jgi:hypothetical protein